MKRQLGTFPFWILPVITMLISSFGILASYFIAVKLGHVKPFPYTDITHSAIQYPEYIIFRAFLIAGAILIAIVMLIASWWFQLQAEKANVTPSGLNFIGKGGVSAGFLLCLSTASISDGGDMDWVPHIIGATGFFITIVFVIGVCTENYIKIYKANPKFIPFYSFVIKIVFQVIILIFVGLYLYGQLGKNAPDWLGNAVEWILTLLVILYIGTFAIDLNNVEGLVTYDHDEANLTEDMQNKEKNYPECKCVSYDKVDNQVQNRNTYDSERDFYVEMPSYQNINQPLNQKI
ncbi:hypothetical protein ABPG72_014814 [Tetrahymena utriculariae]